MAFCFPRLALSLCFLGTLLVTPPLSAHPHVWADVKAEITVSAGYVEGVWAVWTFDDVFSQLILSDNDPGPSGKINAKVNASIKKGYFDNLKAYGWFSHFSLAARNLEVPEPTKFQALITPQGRVQYRFFLPLGVRLDANIPLAVSFYDDSFFTDMVFEKKFPITLTATGGKASALVRPDKSRTFYGGQVTPIFAFISWNPS